MLGLVRALICGYAVCVGLTAQAQEGPQEVPLGVWQTERDAAGVVLHVRTRNCGSALCGRVERAKNRGGYDAPSNAVGERVFWRLKSQADGSFLGKFQAGDGTEYKQTRVVMDGKALRLEACNDDLCKTLLWKRIR